jgi:HAD superfamily hydrolase (TIGR01549 family)
VPGATVTRATGRGRTVGIVRDVPDHAESAEPDHPIRPRSGGEPPAAVLFDFHGTLAQVEDPVSWVLAAATACGTDLDRARATALADRFVTVGRAGGPLPHRIPPHLAEAWADRDLTGHAHRAAYTGLAHTVECGIDGLADALYERVLRPEGWRAYADSVPTLAALRDAAVPVALVSNVGFDLRPITAALGLDELIGAYVLSFEVGRCKPDPGIFEYACATLGVPPEKALMVGDTPADAGAVRAGCRAYLVPAGEAEGSNGLGGVLSLAGLG